MNDKGKNRQDDAPAKASEKTSAVDASSAQKSADDSAVDSHNEAREKQPANDHQDDDAGEDGNEVIKVERTPTSPALLSQLRHSNHYHQARGLGAGRAGAATFRVQRLTAMALIPLAIWFAVSVVRMSTASQAAAAAWLAWPVNAVIMALFIVIALRHAVIGLQIILEDYVHHEGLRAVCVLVVKAIGLLLGVGAVAALIHLAL